MDLWHVPMHGKEGTLHLMALREDSEAQREVLAPDDHKDVDVEVEPKQSGH